MIQAIIFDLDNTLINRNATFTAFLENQFDRLGSKIERISKTEYTDLVLNYDNNGYTRKADLYDSVCQKLNWATSISQELLNDFLLHYGKNPILFDGVHQVLKLLRTNFKLGLVTNGRSKGQRLKINQSGSGKYFRSIRISEEDEVKKPNQKIFENCLKELNVEAYRSVYVGDHPENDVEAAKQAGMLAIWLENKWYSTPKCQDGTIASINELPNLVRDMN